MVPHINTVTAETKSNTYATVRLKQQYTVRSVSVHVDVNSSAPGAEMNVSNDGNDTRGENLNLLLTNHTLFFRCRLHTRGKMILKSFLRLTGKLDCTANHFYFILPYQG